MLHSDVLTQIKKDRQHGQSIYPDYGRYSLAEVAPTILSLFGLHVDEKVLPDALYKKTADGCKNVLFFLMDGLGYDAFSRYRSEQIFFDHLVKRADVYPITTVFPSTTAAAHTTINSSLTPQQHGLPEWVLYLHEVNRVVESIPFTTLDGISGEDVGKLGGDPSMLYSGQTIHERLQEAGITSFIFINKKYADNAYSKACLRGATVVPYFRHSDLMVKLRQYLKENKTRSFFYVYWPEIDSISHRFGPHSEEYRIETSVFSHLMMNAFFSQLTPKDADNTFFILTSDHGQIKVNPRAILRLNDHAILKNMEKRPDGRPIPPVGSPRDIFLHVRPELLQKTIVSLRKEFGDRSQVLSTDEAIQMGLFGVGTVSERFIRRAGNALMIPNPDTMIWYEYNQEEPIAFLGHHGGLSEQEMIIPFVTAKLRDLII